MGLRQVAISALALALLFTPSHAVVIKSGGSAAGVSFGTWEPLNWTPDFVAVWSLDEGTSSDRVSNPLSSCGSSCDLTPVAVDQDTSLYKEGSASAAMTAASGSLNATNLQCDADNDDSDSLDNCTALDISSGNLSWGGWFNLGSQLAQAGVSGPSDNYVQILGTYTGGSSDNGYGLFYQQSGYSALYHCVMDGSDLTTSVFANTAITSDIYDATWHSTWTYIACTYDASTDVLSFYYRDDDAPGDSGKTLSSVTALTSSSANFRVGTTQTDNLQDFNVDDLFVAQKALTATDICRICSCGADGSACSCVSSNQASYVDKGRNAACGDCTLPNCNSSLAGS